jgi:hypothetical protein
LTRPKCRSSFDVIRPRPPTVSTTPAREKNEVAIVRLGPVPRRWTEDDRSGDRCIRLAVHWPRQMLGPIRRLSDEEAAGMDGRLMQPIGLYLMIENGGHLAAHLHSSRRRKVLQFKVGVGFIRISIRKGWLIVYSADAAAGGR